MANGLEMLMKTFGIDPNEIKGSVEGFKALVLRLATAVERVEQQNRAIMVHLGVEQHGHVGHSGSVEQPGHASNGVGDGTAPVVIVPGSGPAHG